MTVCRFDHNYTLDSMGNLDEVFMEHDEDGPYVAYSDYVALLDRIESAEKALKVYGDACDDEHDMSACKYEPHMCCKSARAHLSQYGERT